MRAVVLLSGGLDSATTLAWAQDQGYVPVCLSFDYGQRHRQELDAAREVASAAGVQDHRVVRIDLAAVGGSALTDPSIPVPDASGPAPRSAVPAIPPTYVPARNTVFLAVAMGLAEVVEASHLFFGANALDYSGYPDCRPAFVEAFEALARVATKAGVEGRPLRVHAPLLHLSKADIVREALRLSVPIDRTLSCYAPQGRMACGRCDACSLRRRGFEEAGVPDPTRYA